MADNRIEMKVCGMRDARNIVDVSALSPDFMGFIFYPKSPRFVGDHFEVPKLPLTIKKVGVFVNEIATRIFTIATEHNLDHVQLHGNESPQICLELKAEGLKIIKVFSVDDNFDFGQTALFTNVADMFLFDTKGKYYGGNAKTFNWKILEKYRQEVPFLLSGGLSPENIAEVLMLKNLNLRGIDVNSGVEQSPGVKDIAKIERIKKILNQ